MANLFTAVSAEQQEIVAGGQIVVVPDLDIEKAAYYNYNTSDITNDVFAGLLGSGATVEYDNINVGSSADDSLEQTYYVYP